MPFAYVIFGLRVHSNFSLPGVNYACEELRNADVTVHFDSSPAAAKEADDAPSGSPFFVSSYELKPGEPLLRIWKTGGDRFTRCDYSDGTRFWIDARAREVWVRWTATSSFEDAASYLLGPIFGYLLRLRGVMCLHASAVVDGGAIAFTGIPGAGKSTTAAAMAQRGHAVLSDDIVALSERADRFYAVPAYPMLALWPEAVEALYGTKNAAPAFSENFEKRRVPLSTGEFASEAVPLGGIFILEERQTEAPAPRIERMAPRDAMMSLVANTYANRLLSEEMRALEFAFLGRLLEATPVWRVRAHEEVSRIGALCELIENEVASAQTLTRVATE